MVELCSCTVAIAGDIRRNQPKPRVTPAEIVLLQAIHGASAVTNIRVHGELDTTSDQERDRLGRFYGDDKVVKQFNQFGDLPTTIDDIRIPDEMLDPSWNREAAKPAKKKAPTRKRARTAKGHFVKDNPETPENEAYVEE